MSKDWTKTVALADRMITNFGRTITLAKLATTPATTGEPWQAATTPPALGALVDQRECKGVATGRLQSLGEDFLKGLDNVIAVAGNFDPKGYDVIVDGESRWRVVRIETLKPGDVAILHFFGVTQ